MTNRWAVVSLAVGCAVAAGVARETPPGPTAATSAKPAAVALLSDQSLVIGPSGVPIPSEDYVNSVNQLYIEHSGYLGYQPNPLYTPEGLYPLTGVKSLELNASVAQGQSILDSAIREQVAAGNNVVVFAYSQSSTISSLEMSHLAANPPEGLAPGRLAFILVGDPSNPNGGLLERFEGLTLPSLGFTFSGATPDNLYPTDIYTQEYDGFADFPRYPLNILADLNAFLGIATVHLTYAKLTPEQVDSAIPLTNTVGETLTNYYMIPTEDLPLLAPLRLIPVLGDPLADLLQPDLKVLVNLGYGDPEFGWSTAPPNVPTPFGLFPSFDDLAKVPGLLATGTQQGITAFLDDLGNLGAGSGGPAGPALTVDPALSPADFLTHAVNALTSAVASGYAALLPTADILNALVTSMPAYDVELFIEALQAGDLVGAIGNPIAADTGLLTMAAGFELLVVGGAVKSIVEDLGGIF